jgi:hypothetical protein
MHSGGLSGARRFDAVVAFAVRAGLIVVRGAFLCRPDGSIVVRSRAGMRLAADRIAPGEYEPAVVMVLQERGCCRGPAACQITSQRGV